jgi:hypothetical protein
MTRFGIIRNKHTRRLHRNSTLKFGVGVQGADFVWQVGTVFGTPDDPDYVPLWAICQICRGITDMPRQVTADCSCSGPLKRLRVKWVLDKDDLRRKSRHFGGTIHDRDTSNYGQTEYGKMTHFIHSVFVS